MKKIIAASIFAVALLVGTYVIAAVPVNHSHTTDEVEHGGGLNRYGCHHDYVHGGYHCH